MNRDNIFLNMAEGFDEFLTFRLKKDSKIPATNHGFKDAKHNDDLAHFDGYNIGFRTGEGLLVVDIDMHDKTKNGFKSMATLSELIKEDLLKIKTLKVKTPNNGLHIYFKYDESYGIPSRNNVLEGIDVKATNGYVVAPTSTLNDGKEYTILDNSKVSKMPEGLLYFLSRMNERKLRLDPVNELSHDKKLVNQDEVEHYLQYLDPDCNREEWRNIAFAMHDMELEEGFKLFDDWSQGSKKHSPNESTKLWNSIKDKGGISYKTFFNLAINEYNAPPFVDTSLIFLNQSEDNNILDDNIENFDDYINEISNNIVISPPRPLPKKIDEWPDFAKIVKDIYNNAPYKYRDASIITAFHLLSSVLADKVDPKHRLNLFTTLIMPTAAGKDFYIKYFEKYRTTLDKEANDLEGNQLETHCIAPAASVQGYQRILKSLPNRTIIDEEIFPSFLGRTLLNGKDKVMEQLNGAILKLYSSSTLRAINNKKVEDSSSRVDDIILSIFGTGVPSDAIKLFSNASVIKQGSTNRFIKVYEPNMHVELFDYELDFSPEINDDIFALLEKYFYLPNKNSDECIEITKTENMVKYSNVCTASIRSLKNDFMVSLKARDVENSIRLASLIAITEAVRNNKKVAKITSSMFMFCYSFLNKNYKPLDKEVNFFKVKEQTDIEPLLKIINPMNKPEMIRSTCLTYASRAFKDKKITYPATTVIEKLTQSGAITEVGNLIKFKKS
jgi:hypothetical protein